MGALIAPPAVTLGLEGYLLPDREALNLLSQLHDLGSQFVALDQRVLYVLVFAVVHMDIRTADSDPVDPQEHLSRQGLRDRDILELDPARGSHHHLLHDLLPPSTHPLRESIRLWRCSDHPSG